MKIVQPDPQGLALAAQAIRQGQVVAHPTETVYGLAVDPFSADAIQRLFAVKDRDAANAVLLIVADVDQLAQIVSDASPRAAAYIRAFWPGPLSLLLPRSARLPAIITAGSPKVCVRCPGSQIARDLCRAVGTPVTSTSANFSGCPPARDLSAAALPGVALGIDAGKLRLSPPSTVFDPDTNEVIREGAFSREELARALHD